MVTLVSLLAALLYAAPLVAFVAVRMRRAQALWELPSGLAVAAAVDVVGVLVLARWMTLERAAWTSRALWTIGLSVAARRSRRELRLRLPAKLTGRAILAAVSSGAVGLGLSLLLSRPYALWDRLWHIPLVSVLRAQRAPFANVYDPAVPLNYHYTGDVLGALVQSFSLGVIHASVALSVAHDVLFTLLGAALGLWLHARRRGALACAALTAAVILTGPVTLFRADAPASGGYAIFNLLTLSFRPHVPLACLLLFGVFVAVAARLLPGGHTLSPGRTAAAILLPTTALALTDETSIVLLCASLGVVWLFAPRAVARTRRAGILVLVGAGALFLLANVVFSGSFAPGAPRFPTAIVDWRLPGYDHPSLPLRSAAARALLLWDLFPILAILLALLVSLPRLRRRGAGLVLLHAVLSIASVVLLLRLEVNRSSIESHRFVTAALLLGPPLALTVLARPLRVPWLSRLLVAAALGLPAASTLAWIAVVLPRQGETYRGFFSPIDFPAVDCRALVGARPFAASEIIYAEQSVWYLYAGCAPVFAPAPPNAHWRIQVKAPYWGLPALRALEGWQPGPELRVICSPQSTPDPVCAYARAHRRCAPAGSAALACTLDEAGRKALLPGQ